MFYFLNDVFCLSTTFYISIIGATIIVVGLYSVVWGKAKDYPLLQHPSATATKDTEAPELPTTSSTLK